MASRPRDAATAHEFMNDVAGRLNKLTNGFSKSWRPTRRSWPHTSCLTTSRGASDAPRDACDGGGPLRSCLGHRRNRRPPLVSQRTCSCASCDSASRRKNSKERSKKSSGRPARSSKSCASVRPKGGGVEDEWAKVISGDRLVRFTYSDLPEGAAFLTAQIAGHEVVYSIILEQREHPFSRHGVERHFKFELRTISN